MSNNWVDLSNSTLFFVCGANPAENHPASIAQLNAARFDTAGRGRNAALLVVDPRQTRTARMINAGYNAANPNDMRKHDRYVRIRPGTNIAFINGVLNSIITWMYANPTNQASINFFAWHNGTASNSTSFGRQFTPDDGSTIKHTLTSAELATAQYSYDGGLTWSAAPLAGGWPKYCDSRVKADPVSGDYKRVVMKTSTGVTFSNMLEFAPDVEHAESVFQRLKTHLSRYPAGTVAQICGCTEADIAAARDAFIATSRFSSSDFGATTASISAAGYRSACIMYAMGGTQFTSGSQGVRSYAIIQTVMGNMGRVGGGINALRGIHNVQGSTDMGVLYDLIPAYSGNPGTNQTYADYQNKMFGNRVLSAKAKVTLDFVAANSDLVLTAQTAGVAGNSISATFVDPAAADAVLSVAVVGNDITVSLGTDAAGAIISTAAAVKAAIEAEPGAAALVAVAHAGTSTGAGLVEAKAKTLLKDGSTANKSAYVPGDIEWQQRGFFNMTREWFGNRDVVAAADIDKLWNAWPKGNGVQHIEAIRRMCPASGATYNYTPTAAAPRISASVVWGQNPCITEPNQSAVRTGFENLDLLVCVDMFANETAQCKRKATGVTYLLPACSHVEEAGSATNSGRWLQWRDRARAPKGNSKSDLELLLRFAKALNTAAAFSHIKDQWKTMADVASLYNAGAGADPFAVLYAKYGWNGTDAFEGITGLDFEGNTLKGSEYVAEQLFKEMCAPLDGYNATGPAGFAAGQQGTIWIFSGARVAHGGAYNPDSKTDAFPAVYGLADVTVTGYGATDFAVDTNLGTIVRTGTSTIPSGTTVSVNYKWGPVGTATATWTVVAGDSVTLTNTTPVTLAYKGLVPAWTKWNVANRARSRTGGVETAGAARQYPRYGWAWLLNRRCMYNNGELAGDVADVFVAPGYLARLWTIGGANTLAEWSWLYRTYNQLADKPDTATDLGQLHEYSGRLPGYTEPYESPYDGTNVTGPNLVQTWGRNTSRGTAANLIMPDSPRGQAKDFPLVLTTIRCVEHFQGGPITRNNPWNVDLEPEPWVEINSVDAAKYGIADGQYVNVVTARSNSTTDQAARTPGGTDGVAPTAGWAKGFRARVGSGTLANQRVAPGTVAIPWHWGERGLGIGSRANDLCIDAWDANTMIGEFKVCLCRVEKVNP